MDGISGWMAGLPQAITVGLLAHLTSAFFLLAVGANVVSFAAFHRGSLGRSYSLALGTLFGVLALISFGQPAYGALFYLLAMTPAAFVGQHALYLGQMKNPFGPTKSSSGAGEPVIDERERDFFPNNVAIGLKQARATSVRYFGWATLSFRYGLPAVVIALLVGLFGPKLYEQHIPPSPQWLWSEDFLRGARYGGAGAYVYVLLYLSRRNFRHDITSGAAVWSAVDLVLGPVLGGVVALLWAKQNPVDPNATATFTSAVVFFAAGLTPRHVASVLEEAAKRLLRAPDDKAGAPPPQPNTKPLTRLHGITPGIAERLEEEGIEDVYGMAMADPLRLIRNTSFDQRQIVAWIDEAILMFSLPNDHEALMEKGITGAIDLAWYFDAAIERQPAGAPSLPKAPGADFTALAAATKVDAVTLWKLTERLYWDGQVQLIWVLYQIGQIGADAVASGADPSPKLAPAG